MTADLVPAIFTIDIGDTPTVTFEAQNLREARKLCHEHWLKEDLAEAKSGGVPLWDGKAKLRARLSLPEETVLFVQAKNNGQKLPACARPSEFGIEPVATTEGIVAIVPDYVAQGFISAMRK
jgi:hypothetical protein